MAAQISVIGHRMSASFFAAQSAIETAFACLASGDAPDIGSITRAVKDAIESIADAGALEPFEVGVVAREALRLADKLKDFVSSSPPEVAAALGGLYEQFSEEAECLALGADSELEQSANSIRADIRSGLVRTYPDSRPRVA